MGIIKETKKKKKKKVVINRKSLKKKVRKTKKTKKRYKGKKIDMERVYTLINRAQITKKPQFFSIETVNADTVQNVLKDAAVAYTREDMKTKVKFKIWTEHEQPLEDVDLDFFADEILEDGQLF